MARLKILFTSTLFLLLLTAFALSANAQNARVYVATSGSDANACTVQSPCQTVTKALTLVNPGGEVVLTENGDYDSFIVTKSVTVSAAPGINANIVSDVSSIGIIMPKTLTAADTVSLRNLNFKSTLYPTVSIAIYNQGAGALYVEGCNITGMEIGVNVNMSGQLYMHDTTIHNSNVAIHLNAAQTEGPLRATIDHCRIEQNSYGISIDPKVIATVRDSVVNGNTTAGLYIFSNKGGMLIDVTVDNSLFSNNNGAVMAYTFNGGTILARLERSTIVRNTTGVGASYPNTIFYTLQNNVIDGNGTNINGALTPLQPK